MRLSVSLDKGVEVVVPKSMSVQQKAQFIPVFVRDKKQWIENALASLQKKQLDRKSIVQCLLPDTIALPALGQEFILHYQHSQTTAQLSCQSGNQLTIKGNRDNKRQIFALLEAFFKDFAKPYLKQKIGQMSQRTGLGYNNLTIRVQKTRWGSCSAKKNINLNYRLLFVAEELLDYVVLHELLHTRHMNHSKKFWHDLQALMPDALSRDKQINQMSEKLPCWIYYKYRDYE